MKRKFKLGTIAISLAAIMFTQSMSIELLSAIAEEIADSLSQEETIEREFYNGNMVDRYNIGNGYIIRENIGNRTETTKEFLMSDDTIMVQQFIEPIHYYENGEYIRRFIIWKIRLWSIPFPRSSWIFPRRSIRK